MNKIAYLVIVLLITTACSNQQKNSLTDNDNTKQAIGGNKDRHGCLTAAGETWSKLSQNCVRIFEVGQRLNPIEVAENEAVISAFVLFNDDQSKIELFLPDRIETTVLDKSEDGSFQNNVYSYNTETLTLYVNGDEKYKAQD